MFGIFGLMIAVFGCIAITTLGIDAACYSSMTKKIPVYPNATVTSEQHNFLRTFGMGETLMMLDTDDAPSTVRNWYGETVAAAYEASKDNRDPFFYMANARYSIAGAEDGTGTQIILSGVCGN